MNQIDLAKLHAGLPTKEQLRQIASTIEPGKGVDLNEVASEIGITASSLRVHANELGCYKVLYIGGRQKAFITPLPEST